MLKWIASVLYVIIISYSVLCEVKILSYLSSSSEFCMVFVVWIALVESVANGPKWLKDEHIGCVHCNMLRLYIQCALCVLHSQVIVVIVSFYKFHILFSWAPCALRLRQMKKGHMAFMVMPRQKHIHLNFIIILKMAFTHNVANRLCTLCNCVWVKKRECATF